MAVRGSLALLVRGFGVVLGRLHGDVRLLEPASEANLTVRDKQAVGGMCAL